MKQILTAVIVLALLGCGTGAENGQHEDEIYGARFKEGKGIQLSDAMKNSLRIETAEVVEGTEDDTGGLTEVPQSALLRTVGGTFVYVVNGEHYLRTEVKPRRVKQATVEIEEGLYPGDQVVKQPVKMLWYTELQALRGGTSCTDEH